MTQESLGVRVGASQSAIARWERGQSEFSAWQAVKLARELQVSLDELLGASES